jgi:hypothetical protein
MSDDEQLVEDYLLNGRPMDTHGPAPIGALPPNGALPPGEVIPPIVAPRPQGNLMRAIQNGIQELGREQPGPMNGPVNGPQARMVNLLSESESSDDEVVADAINVIAPNAQYRQGEQAQRNKDEQSSLRRELLDGVNPGKFSKGFPLLHEIKSQAQKDSAAFTFVQKVVKIAEKLEMINVAISNEQCPVRVPPVNMIRLC